MDSKFHTTDIYHSVLFNIIRIDSSERCISCISKVHKFCHLILQMLFCYPPSFPFLFPSNRSAFWYPFQRNIYFISIRGKYYPKYPTRCSDFLSRHIQFNNVSPFNIKDNRLYWNPSFCFLHYSPFFIKTSSSTAVATQISRKNPYFSLKWN